MTSKDSAAKKKDTVLSIQLQSSAGRCSRLRKWEEEEAFRERHVELSEEMGPKGDPLDATNMHDIDYPRSKSGRDGECSMRGLQWETGSPEKIVGRQETTVVGGPK